MRLTGVKVRMWAVRGRPSKGTVDVLVSLGQIESLKRSDSGLHIFIRDQPDYSNRLVLNAEQVEQLVFQAGYGHLIT
jgi:hypothetical protein